MNKNIKSIIFPSIVIIILLLLINPFSILMTDNIQMMILAVLSILLILFFILFWNEKAQDEREYEHIAFSGRLAFVVGGIVLTIALILQSVQHNLDPWIPFTLITMVFAKTLAIMYSKTKR